MHNIAIIGAGISGLYTALKLLTKRDINFTVDVLEASDRIGGRIQTHREIVSKEEVQFECGAGRIAKHHKLLWALIRRYNLEKHAVQLSPNKTWLDKPNYNIKSFTDRILAAYDKISRKRRYQSNFHAWAATILKPDELQDFIDAFAYAGKFHLMNVEDACHAIKDEIYGEFYALTCGLDQIVNKLLEEVQSLGKSGFKLKLNKSVSNIESVKGSRIKVSFNSAVTQTYDEVYIAAPLPHVRHFDVFKPVEELTQAVGSKPLLRVYGLCPGLKLPNRVTTTSPLKYVIPIRNDIGLHMISYTDYMNARSWMLIENEERRNALIGRHLKKVLQPYGYKKCDRVWWEYWNLGTCYWMPGYDPKPTRSKLCHPVPSVYVVGESVAHVYHSWMEGALESVEMVFRDQK